MKAALMLALFGAAICFAGCAKEDNAKVESKSEVTTPDGGTQEVKVESEVTTETK